MFPSISVVTENDAVVIAVDDVVGQVSVRDQFDASLVAIGRVADRIGAGMNPNSGGVCEYGIARRTKRHGTEGIDPGGVIECEVIANLSANTARIDPGVLWRRMSVYRVGDDRPVTEHRSFRVDSGQCVIVNLVADDLNPITIDIPGVDAVRSTGDGEVLDRDVVGTCKLEHVTAGRRVPAIQHRPATATHRTPSTNRPPNRDPAKNLTKQDVVPQQIVARIHIDNVARTEFVGTEQGRQTSHRLVGTLARIQIVTHCRGEHVAIL